MTIWIIVTEINLKEIIDKTEAFCNNTASLIGSRILHDLWHGIIV